MKVICTLLATVLSAMAASSDPGECAVRFLEKVRAHELNLEPGADTALAPQTTAAKREVIARRLERLARDLGNDPLEVGPVKLDGDLAGVLVRKISGFDPNRTRVFAVALVRRGLEWTPAPVPASFENSGVGYAAGARKRLSALEDWMLREQVLDLAALRDQSADRMRRKIAESLPEATLRTLGSRQVAERFLSSCKARDLPEMLGLLGGLATHLPADWPLRIKAAEMAVTSGADPGRPWRLLVSNAVLQAIVLHDEDGQSANLSIACLDPAGGDHPASRPRILLVHLEMTKSGDGLWRIDLPGAFLQESENPEEITDEDFDRDLLEAFPAEIRALYPARPLATAEEAREALTAALHQGDLSSLMRLIPLDGDPPAARESCIRAAQLWWITQGTAAVRRAIPLDIRVEDESAAASFQVFSASHPDRLDLKILYFKEHPAGWFWTPEPDRESELALRDWTDLQSGYWRDHWQEVVLGECPVLEKFPGTKSSAEEEARALIESWLRSIRAGDVTAALRLTTRLNLPDSASVLLRNLGYELTGAGRQAHPPTITGIYRGGGWTAVGTRFELNGKPSFPLYPVVQTPAGPRILVEVDLSASAMRARNFLNKTSLHRLETLGSDPPPAASLEALLNRHQAEALKPAAP